MTLTAARQVADAVMYEGYLLYPYRASSAKNQVRWQFGVLGPTGAAAAGTGEEDAMSTDLVVAQHGGGSVEVYLRFLQVQSRVVERWTHEGWEPVDELVVGQTRWIAFHEAVSREIPLLGLAIDAPCSLAIGVPGGQEVEDLVEDGQVVGRLVRTRWALTGTVQLTPRAGLDARLTVLTLRVANETVWAPGAVAGWTARDVAARRSFVGTHLLLAAEGCRFLSLLDGPSWAEADASSCLQHRCWPVLIAADDGSDAVLVAPIILGDHPTIAPESAGDLFDATEIDEILTLRVMTMTEAEKAEARGTDPRAAAILARCDTMSDDALSRLHGTRRPSGQPGPAEVPVFSDADADAEADVPWWDAGQDARADPDNDSLMVGGVRVAKGSRVMLRPTRRADAQDIFFSGLTAEVARVYFDVDGNTHVAVMLEDDPGSDLYSATGRFYYFGPEEIEPLPAREEAR